MPSKLQQLFNAKISVFVLFVLKQFYIGYYIICMTLPLRISSVNVIKSAVSCGFGHIHSRIP